MTNNSEDNSKPDNKVAFAALPLTDYLEPTVKIRVRHLLETLDQVAAQRASLEVQEDDLKMELEALQKTTGRTGFRYGFLTFCSQPVAGRRTLDRMLLIENGVAAAIINDSMKTGKPSTRNTFKRLSAED